MKTLRRYLWKEIATATGFMLFALLSLFTFFDLVAQLDEIGQRGFKLRHALAYVAFTLPSRMYEVMPIAALIGTIYVLSKLAANSEFTIMRVSGMSTRRLMMSLLGHRPDDGRADVHARRGGVAAGGKAGAADAAEGAWRQISVRDFSFGCVGTRRRQGGGWTIGAYRFINVRQVSPDVGTKGWRIIEFDSDYRLRSIVTADAGRYVPNVGGN